MIRKFGKCGLLLLAFSLVIVYALTVASPVSAAPVMSPLIPSSGYAGQSVTADGTGFSATDTWCKIDTYMVVSAATCVMRAGGVATGFFLVGTNAPGAYPVTIDGGVALVTKDKAPPVIFDVLYVQTPPPSSGPSITLTDQLTGIVGSGSPGDTVSVTGSGFGPMMVAACTMAGNGLTMDSPVCHYNDGKISGSFVIDPATAPGTYTITVTAPSGISQGAPFTVGSSSGQGNCDPNDPTSPCYTGSNGNGNQQQTFNPTITLTPQSGPDGTSVAVSGSGFNPQDASCEIQAVLADGSPAQVVGSPSCTTDGQGDVTGSFTVASNNQPGSYDIVVAGDQGDYGYAPFTVTSITTVTATTDLTMIYTNMNTTATTSTQNVTQIASTSSTSTSTNTAGLVQGIDPSTNPVILAIVAIVGICMGSAVAYLYANRGSGASGNAGQDDKPKDEKAEKQNAEFCPGCGGQLPRHYSSCPINDSKGKGGGATKGAEKE